MFTEVMMLTTKICVLCGSEFVPKTNAQKVCERAHYRKCEVCGKEFEITRPSNSQKCCSKECTAVKRKQTMLERHGVEYAQQSKAIRAKSEATNLRKFGVAYAAQSQEIKEKERMIFQQKYGVDTPFQMSDFAEKRKQTCLEKYGVEHHLQTKESLQRMKQHYTETCLDRFGVPYACMTEQCMKSYPGLISSINRKFGELLTDNNIPFKFEFRLQDKSYDIAILNSDVLIEIDPTYAHSCIKTHWNSSRSNDYHLEKTQLARQNGYRCIHVFDWDDWDKIIDLLKPKATIFARNCEIKEVPKKDADDFENYYHLQNSCRNQSCRLGLYMSGELIQLMTFGKPRYNSNYEWELLRLCSLPDYYVVGGANRLFTTFIRSAHPTSVISYCDEAKFVGGVYSKLGFQLKSLSEPAKIWSKGSSRVTDNLLRQRGYDQLFGTSFGKGTSNEELMLQNGWRPVYDCGQATYIYLTEADLR